MTPLTEVQVDALLQSPWVADYFEAACGIEPWATQAQTRRNAARVALGAEPDA